MMVANLGWIEKTTRSLCRRYGLVDDEADDFHAWVQLKLVENDYAPLRKFLGKSSLPTYLTVVVTALFREYRVMDWGRWRPSAAAQRLGVLAVRLETLVYRDGLSLSQAGEVLRSEDPRAPKDGDLARLLAQLPMRGPVRPVDVGEAALDDVPDSGATTGIEVEEEVRERERMQAALHRAIEALPAEDGWILRLKFWHGHSTGDVARSLGLDQKSLFRRIRRLTYTLRRQLENEGIDRSMVAEVLASDAPR
jgi:RNA polymerase sigma factor (sigma-70 family)